MTGRLLRLLLPLVLLVREVRAGDAVWATKTASPSPAQAVSSDESMALSKCGPPEQGLMVAARELAELRLGRHPMPEANELAIRMRRAGEPHVWPRAWAIVGDGLSMERAASALDEWARSVPAGPGQVRCGVGIARDAAGMVAVAALSVDAVADLSPIPTRVRAGQWVTLEARILIPASGAHVVVQGPDGPAFTPPSTFYRGKISSRFSASGPGAYVVQFLADTVNGPRPVLEARLFSDVAPNDSPLSDKVPGEEGTPLGADDVDDLLRLTNALRRQEKLGVLVRDGALDAVARAHSSEMARKKVLGHDVGDGAPDARAKSHGIAPHILGENVAHSDGVREAHRALYASISHRENLLQPEFARMGIAVVHDADGSVWVTELFASAR